MKKDDLFKIIDELISLFRNAALFTIYERAIYQMDGLLLSLMSKDNEIYKNFIGIVSSTEDYLFRDNKLEGVLWGLKNQIEICQNKKYQIFISSTYKDLIPYRATVSDAVIYANQFPAGMEDFKASHANPTEYIKNVIDCSDYYILIIGQRFGSIQDTATNTSFTMMEYNYAINKEMVVILFVYSGFDKLPGNDLAQNQKLLEDFKNEISIKHTPSYFGCEDELKKQVTQSLNDAIQQYPQAGWLRFG